MEANSTSVPAVAPAFQRDRAVIAIGLACITLLAWAYLIHMNRMMGEARSMAEMGMPMMHGWDDADLWMMFTMWAVMMVAMMVPSATPMILGFAAVNRQRARHGGPYVNTTIFLAGYLAIWCAFSFFAAVAQWGIHSAALLQPQTLKAVPWLGGGLLIAAGAFQLSPLKNACLARCRSPFDFLATEWREGKAGAFWMGMSHGFFCVGCCWLLMLLLFVAGVMNLLWVATIAAFVLGEKLLPRGELVRRVGAIIYISGGIVWMLANFY